MTMMGKSPAEAGARQPEWSARATIEVPRSTWGARFRIVAMRALSALTRPFRRPAPPASLYLACDSDATVEVAAHPALIGSWKVLGLIASGTSAAVYRVVPAWAPGSHEHYALKLHSDRLSGERDARSRFRREIRILKSLRHRNVVGMVEAGEFNGRLFIVMELVEGRSLKEALDREKPPLSGKLDWAIQISRALAAVHRRGVVHRDLKPANILTTRVGVVKLADFGLAVGTDVQKITKPGFLVGTPAYMAPETLMGVEPDVRADLYSLGVVLYEIFAGRMPYEAQTVSDFISGHLFARPEPLRRHAPTAPAALEKLLLRLLEKDPTDRVQSADAVREELEEILADVAAASRSHGAPSQVA